MIERFAIATDQPDLTLRQLTTTADAVAEFHAIEENRQYLSEYGNSVGRLLTSAEAIKDDWAYYPQDLFMGLWHKNTDLQGVIGVHPQPDDTAAISYWLRYSAQGNGYATTALRAITSYIQSSYNTVYTEIQTDNAASVNVSSRAGYVQADTVLRYWNGQHVAAYVFEAAPAFTER